MAKHVKEAFANVGAIVAFALIVIGFGGLSWDVFRDGGLLERGFGLAWEAQVRNPMIMVPVLLGGLILLPMFLRGGFNPGKAKQSWADFAVYGLMAVGFYYVVRWLFH